MRNIYKKIIFFSVIILIMIPICIIGVFIGLYIRGASVLQIDNFISITTSVFGGIAGFIGSLLGVLGAFYIYRLQSNDEKQIKINQEVKQKQHKEMMLYTLLDFTYLQTRTSYNHIIESYKNTYEDSYKELVCKYNLSGDLKKDFDRMLFVKPCEDTERFDYHINKISEELVNYMRKKNISDRVVYMENWYEFIDCIDDLEDLNTVIFWITMLKNSDKNIDVNSFISNRESIGSLIEKRYPRVKYEGIRGKFRMINRNLKL